MLRNESASNRDGTIFPSKYRHEYVGTMRLVGR